MVLAAGCKIDNPLFIDSGGSESGSQGPGTAVASESTTAAPSSMSSTTEGPEDTTSQVEGSSSLAIESSTADTSSGTTLDPELCGNGSQDPGEQCDDANLEPGDGCEANCRPLFEVAQVLPMMPLTAIAAVELEQGGPTGLALGRTGPSATLALANQGAGMFAEFDVLPVAPMNAMAAVIGLAGGDLDDNSDPDLAVAQSNSQIHLYFQEQADFGAPAETINDSSAEGSLRLLDGDGDGALDVLFAQPDFALVVMVSVGDDGKYSEKKSFDFGGPVRHFAVGALGEGEAPDLVATFSLGDQGFVQLWYDFAGGVPDPLPPIEVGKAVAGVAIAELLADAPGPELVIAGAGDQRLWLLRRKDEQGPYEVVEGPQLGESPKEVRVLPLRGGDALDVLTLDGDSGDVHVVATTPQGLADQPVVFPTVADPVGWATADFTGDGRIDVVVASESQGVVLLENLSGS